MKEEVFCTKEDIENESEIEYKSLKHVTFDEVSKYTYLLNCEALNKCNCEQHYAF